MPKLFLNCAKAHAAADQVFIKCRVHCIMRHSRFCLIPLLLLLTGCADDGRVPTFPATGVVRYPDGTPLVGGAILCESPHGLAARATINDDGAFQLGTYDVDDGAVEGTHKVAIRPPRSGDYNPDAGVAPPPTIDARFFSMDTSGIEFDVTADGPNHFTIEVTRQAPRSRGP